MQEQTTRLWVNALWKRLEDEEVESFAWIEGKGTIADILTKQGSIRECLEEIIKEGRFENAFNVNNLDILIHIDLNAKFNNNHLSTILCTPID